MSALVIYIVFVLLPLGAFVLGYWAGDRSATRDTERRWSEIVARAEWERRELQRWSADRIEEGLK